MKEKHLPYFELLDSFGARECPICFLTKAAVERYFDNLLYENVNDAGFRKSFRENQGFCNSHAHKFASYNDGLAISITHKDLLSDALGELASRARKLPSRKKQGRCIVCELIKDTEERHISVIIDYLEDQEFKNRFASSEPLCVPHLKLFLKKMKAPPKWFLDFHLKKYEHLLASLARYIDSCNVSLGDQQPRLSHDDKLIWRKVVNTLFGFEGKAK
jgi:hypothetical protein